MCLVEGPVSPVSGTGQSQCPSSGRARNSFYESLVFNPNSATLRINIASPSNSELLTAPSSMIHGTAVSDIANTLMMWIGEGAWEN
jgi:hypothetical protein